MASMAKKKKGRKARKQASQNLKNMSVPQLIQKGTSFLSADNYRDAIKILKIANQKQPDNHQCLDLLFRAYTYRENQLRQKKMLTEADALHHQVLQHLPDTTTLKEADLLLCLKSTSMKNAVVLYSRFLAHHPPVLEAETILTDLLLTFADWQAATQLPDIAMLKPDLPLLQKAARLMDDAQWEAALEQLKPVSRRSPLAAVKLLCRAMVCFYQNDDQSMQRALAMIPASFGLSSVIERLRTDSHHLSALWQGSFVTDAQTHLLLDTIKQNDFTGTARIIKRMAQALCPQDPCPAIEQLLLMLWPLAASQSIDSCSLAELAELMLPGDRGKAMAAKFYFLGFDDYLVDTNDYLELLDKEFPDPADSIMAASMVLSESVERIVNRGLQEEAKELMPDDPAKQLGVFSNHPECVLLEITLKALELDPQNLQARTLLAQLPRTSRPAKQLAETGLQTMMDTFPDDPQPCLALAKLYSEKNAFRKVETCLRQAELRAPHDEQVREFHVLALLQSIDTNLNRKKFHLVKADLEKAEKRCTRKILAPMTARRILFDLEQTGQLSVFGGKLQNSNEDRIRAIISGHISGLSDSDMLKALGILEINRRQRPKAWNKVKSSLLESMFKSHAKTVNRLPSKVIRDLLLQEVDNMAVTCERTAWLAIFLTRYKTILKRIDNEDILPLLEILVEIGKTEQCLQEIRRRMKTASEPFRTLLEFLQMVVRCIVDESHADADAFAAIIDHVDKQHLEMFRTTALRLSKSARGTLKDALVNFDFKFLENTCNCPRCTGRLNEDYEDDFNFDLFDIFDKNMDDPIYMMVEMVESLIDMEGLRGARERVIKKHRKNLMNDYKTKTMLRDVAEMLSFKRRDELSPEARILIFG